MQVTPELHTQFKVGDRAIFVVEVEEPNEFGWTWITGHDDEGEEVSIRMITISQEQYDEQYN